MRQVQFTIAGHPDILVMVKEQSEGSLLFDLTTDGPETGDIRALFFNIAEPTDALAMSGSGITEYDFGDVIDLGQGANLRGGGRKGYDIGIEFGTPGQAKDDIHTTSFTLSRNGDDPLTLDDIAYQEFGARVTSTGTGKHRSGSEKITAIAPAAPNAFDDEAATLEDVAVTIDAVANDTDADLDQLTVTSVGDPQNGTAMIVDNAIVYQGDLHWSGTDKLTYTITDGNGGWDTASITVEVAAVADAPDLSVGIAAGAGVQEAIINIASALVDADGSESLALRVSGLPDDVTMVGAPGGVIADPTGSDSLTLLLPEGRDFDFDLAVTAIATEVSNGDMASTTETVNIVFDYEEQQRNATFEADGLDMWGPGPAFTFDDERFLGLDESGGRSGGSLITYEYSYDLKMGLDSDLHIEGGEFSADVPYDFDFATAYNRATDALAIDTAASLAAGGRFLTAGPSMTYALDFIFEAALAAELGIKVNLGVDTLEEEFFDFSTGLEWSNTLIDYDSETSGGLQLPLPFGFSGYIEWPQLSVAGDEGISGLYTGSGASSNFVQLNNDVDQLLADILFSGVNPFDFTADVPGAEATLELLDVDLSAGLNFIQDFALQAGRLDASLMFEDGSEQGFTFGDRLVFSEASRLDADGDGDIDFNFAMDLVDSTFSNDTDIGFNVGYNLDVGRVNWKYDVFGFSDSGSIGPVIDEGGTLPVTEVDVYEADFGIAFAPEVVSLIA